MKNISVLIALVVIIAVGIWVFSLGTTEAPDEEVVEQSNEEVVVLEDGQYQVATSSQIFWQGSKPLLANYTDSGHFSVSEGFISVASSSIATGSFTIDIESLVVTETGIGTGEDTLAQHLASGDFFNAKDYPEANFVITSVENGEVLGDLTMKGITEEVSMPVSFVSRDGEIVMQGQTSIDRTKWGINYNSDSFFQNLGENVISDEVIITLDIILEKTS